MKNNDPRADRRSIGALGASLLLLPPLLAAAASALAQTTPAAPAAPAASTASTTTLDPVEIRGARTPDRQTLSNAPEALPTQTYTITRDKLEALPFADATDLLRSTPGITFGSSSPGGDIGDDISIRGFNGFHGAATAVLIDGVPVNWSHSGFGAHGTADFNWLTPELIERIEIVKGPFSALYGNFNLSGAINIVTRASDAPSLAAEAGSHDNVRGVGVYSRPQGAVTPFIALEALYRGGYRDHSAYRRFNSFNKLGFGLGDGRVALRLNASVRDFDSAGFLLASDVRSGAVSRRSAAPDALTDNGRIETLAAVANYVANDPAGLAATLYAGHDRYRLADASFGPPQAYFSSRRSYAGWRALQSWSTPRSLLTYGSDGQFSDGRNRNANTDGAANPTTDTVSTDVRDLQAGLFAQGQFKLVDAVKLVGGLRYDYVRTRVENRLYANSGSASTDIFSPKIGIVATPIREVEIFANTGRGFRTPAASELSPNRAGAPFNSSLGVAKLESSDLGVTLRPLAGLSLTGAYFKTDTQRELRRDPANPANVVNIGGTSRKGYELVGVWQIDERLGVNLSHTHVATRIKEPATATDTLVVTVPDDTQTASLAWRGAVAAGLRLDADLFAQRIGWRPLAADGSLYAESQTVYGAKARLTRGRVSGFVQLDYAPDKYSSDFVYDLGSGPVYDPRPTLALLVGVKYAFD